MYPLLAIYLQLYGLCAGNGIDPSNVSRFLQGRDSRIMQTDRAMWDLVAEAGASAWRSSSTPSPSRSATNWPSPAATPRCG